MSRGGRFRARSVAEAVLWLLLLAVPLVLLPSARDSFTLPKRLVGEWLALASLFVLALGAARRRRLDLRAVRRHPAVRAVLPLLAAALLGWAFTDHPAHVRAGLISLAVGCAAVAGWSLGLSAHRLRRLLAALLIPGTLLALLAILQFHGVADPFGFAFVQLSSRYGITSLAGNAGHLAAFLALTCVVGQALLPTFRSPRLRWPAAAALLLSAYALILTQTLAALAALTAGSLVVWACLLPRRKALALAAAGLTALVLLVVAVEPLRVRVTERVADLVEGDLNDALTGRPDGWRAALWMVGEEPITGVGHGAYVSEFADAKLALLDRGADLYGKHFEPVFANAHNELLEAVAEWGLLGLAALAWALWVLAGAARRAAAGGGDAALTWGGLTVLAVLALVHFPFRLALTGFPALVLLAWIFRRGGAGADDEGSGGEPAAADPGRTSPAWWGWLLVAVLAAALVGHGVHVRDQVRANRILNAVEQMTNRLIAVDRVQSTVLWAHLRLLREAGGLAPADARLPLAAGSQYLLLQRPAEALEQYEQSLRLEPRPEALLNRGRAQLALGNREAAVDSFVDAVRLLPRFRQELPAGVRREVMRRVRAAEEGAGS